jgi:hypothetical protein
LAKASASSVLALLATASAFLISSLTPPSSFYLLRAFSLASLASLSASALASDAALAAAAALAASSAASLASLSLKALSAAAPPLAI